MNYAYYTSGEGPQAGRLKSVSSAAGTTAYIYDKMGNVAVSSQTIAGYTQTMNFGYDWYPGGGLKSMTYPSGRKMEYAIDDAGRNTKVSTTGKIYWDTTNVMQPFTADGRVRQAQFGNGLWETYEYAAPGTATVYSLGTTPGANDLMRLEYNFDGENNNGNIVSQSVSVNNGIVDLTQNFTYDGVNRLLSASETGVGGYTQTYGYDQFSNRWASSIGLTPDANEPTAQSNFNAATNRLNGVTYDAAGNQQSYNGYTYEYDADGRNTAVKYANGVTYMTNVYDGEGRRVKKVESNVTTYYVYDAFGRLAAEYTTDTPAAGTSYLFTDMLGSVRAVTSSTGALQECYDYLPFGRLLMLTRSTKRKKLSL